MQTNTANTKAAAPKGIFRVSGRNGRRVVFANSKDLAVRAYTEAGNAAGAVQTAYGFVGAAK